MTADYNDFFFVSRPQSLMKIYPLLPVIFSCAGLCFANPFDGPNLKRFTFSEPHMGTTFKIILHSTDEQAAQKAAKAAFIHRCEELFNCSVSMAETI